MARLDLTSPCPIPLCNSRWLLHSLNPSGGFFKIVAYATYPNMFRLRAMYAWEDPFLAESPSIPVVGQIPLSRSTTVSERQSTDSFGIAVIPTGRRATLVKLPHHVTPFPSLSTPPYPASVCYFLLRLDLDGMRGRGRSVWWCSCPCACTCAWRMGWFCHAGFELDDLKLANDEEMDHVEDLIALPHLHEAAILHSLCR